MTAALRLSLLPLILQLLSLPTIAAAEVKHTPRRTRARGPGPNLAEPGAPDPSASAVSVRDFGAVPDGVTDNTAAFQRAIDSLRGNASVAPGGVVWVPAGQWSFAGSLLLPRAVSLIGTYVSVPAHPVGEGGDPPSDGSILMPRGGRGDADGTPFLVLGDSASVRGVVFYYPDQLATAAVTPYPWTIALRGENCAVLDVELLNSFRGINATGAPRHTIRRVQGQPTDIGIYVDETYDIGRITDVHWNPWFSQNQVSGLSGARLRRDRRGAGVKRPRTGRRCARVGRDKRAQPICSRFEFLYDPGEGGLGRALSPAARPRLVVTAPTAPNILAPTLPPSRPAPLDVHGVANDARARFRLRAH